MHNTIGNYYAKNITIQLVEFYVIWMLKSSFTSSKNKKQKNHSSIISTQYFISIYVYCKIALLNNYYSIFFNNRFRYIIHIGSIVFKSHSSVLLKSQCNPTTCIDYTYVMNTLYSYKYKNEGKNNAHNTDSSMGFSIIHIHQFVVFSLSTYSSHPFTFINIFHMQQQQKVQFIWNARHFFLSQFLRNGKFTIFYRGTNFQTIY